MHILHQNEHRHFFDQSKISRAVDGDSYQFPYKTSHSNMFKVKYLIFSKVNGSAKYIEENNLYKR